MKRSILVTTMMVLAAMVSAQCMLMSFDDFKATMKAAKIPGYTQMGDMEQGSSDYTASYFNNMEDYLLIKLEAQSAYAGYTKNAKPFTLDGNKAVISTQGENAMLAVEIIGLKATLVVAASKSKDKAVYEAIARATNLMTKKAKSSDWPTEIPASCRPAGTMVSYTKQASETEGVRVEITVSMLMSAEFKASVKKLRTSFEDNGSFVTLAGGIMMINLNGELDDLNTCCKDGEKVELLFYIP